MDYIDYSLLFEKDENLTYVHVENTRVHTRTASCFIINIYIYMGTHI